ncbi:hypothetical protein A2303_01170 [Candidatus Falkowbacteria bacterium RIFOXYB2_FULL_47_14]|uniref:Uncharacterized protein n=1 Tax=Candidatus Falkowbacteria bacterium RIFOXYA2_FULL_47_19 TaxID=1797994 RepID=A0A1F5SHA5_9BACT|nr:MAG: hypothetical protein A2227_00370 [Candidatus Falkowbacteria bacterium RIFOXYA2_FULL_47_19]OGF35543.1 MAG: hypothetical protein A2468_05905 [Candidatus Falkowbacteria bacterium RIFOXYC2_FULL_46_15]OGF42974.1 MAG: hypothetical protein A2303_01170 [Candidatus Falkowbacteria bacterium RIFOXYB2_FULL_47_14]
MNNKKNLLHKILNIFFNILFVLIALYVILKFKNLYKAVILSNYYFLLPVICIFLLFRNKIKINKIKSGEFLAVITIILGLIFFIFQNSIEIQNINNHYIEIQKNELDAKNSFYCVLTYSNFINLKKATNTVQTLTGFEKNRFIMTGYVTDPYYKNLNNIYLYLGSSAIEVVNVMESMDSVNNAINIVQQLDLSFNMTPDNNKAWISQMIVNRNKEILENSEKIYNNLSALFLKYKNFCIIN